MVEKNTVEAKTAEALLMGESRMKSYDSTIEILASGKPILTFTHDRRVIIEGDVYEAAKVFWDVLTTQILPKSWTVEVRSDEKAPS